MAKLQFTILTPEKTSYEGEVDSVTIDTHAGIITVLPQHAPLLSILRPGEMIIRANGKEELLAVHGGFVNVQEGSVVNILADAAERADDIDEARAEEAVKRAEELQKEKASMDQMEYARVAAKLERDLARLRIVRRRR